MTATNQQSLLERNCARKLIPSWVSRGVYSRGRKMVDVAEISHVGADELHGIVPSASEPGTEYRVSVYMTPGTIRSTCSCPYGAWCKHVVALALKYADGIERPAPRTRGRRRTPSPATKLKRWLDARSKEELRALLDEAIAEEKGLRIRLQSRAISEAASDAEVVKQFQTLYESIVNAVLKKAEFAEWSHDWDARITVPETMRREWTGLLQTISARPAGAKRLALTERLSAIVDETDTSTDRDWSMDDLEQLIWRPLNDLERESLFTKSPIKLAQWMLDRTADHSDSWVYYRLGASHEYGHDAAYRDVLGDAGWAYLREHGLARYLEGDERERRRGSLRWLLEHEGRERGDVELQLAVWEATGAVKDSRKAIEHLRYLRRFDEAVAFAERAVVRHPQSVTLRQLAEELRVGQRGADSVRRTS